jgi:poly-gamma-glutamate capsule biosynthesis protein CapA/YwtB (metallophosphatase superfamily)
MIGGGVGARAARSRADVVVAYVHWGREEDRGPTGEMRGVRRRAAGARADRTTDAAGRRRPGQDPPGVRPVAVLHRPPGSLNWTSSPTLDAVRRALPPVAVAAARALVACTLVAGPLAACSRPASTEWRPPSPSPSAEPPVPTSKPAVAEQITLAFAGDVHFTGRTRGLLDDPATAFGAFAPALRGADFAMVNLETAVTTRGTPEPKEFHFRAPASAYQAIRAAGVDLVSLANNHALDYGRVGLADTLASAREAGMPVVGAGANAAAAYAPYVVDVRGVRLGVVAFSQVHALSSSWRATDTRSGIATAFDVERAVGAVTAARQRADVVIVFMHWGIEGDSCPSGEMKTFARRMARAGADIIVGTHAHTLLGSGWMEGAYIHYGLGNFVWYSVSRSTETGVLRLTIRRGEVARSEFLPGVVSPSGQPRPATGAALDRVEAKIAEAARCSGLSPRPN